MALSLKGLGLLLALLIIPSLLHTQETIRITNGEWPPYLCETLEEGGVTSHITREAFALEGINVQYGWFPWARALANVRNGDWDASLGWAKTPEREKDFLFSDSVLEGKIVFFHLKDYPFDWKTLEDLRELRIGAVISHRYNDDFIEAERSGKIIVDRVSSEQQNLSKLLSGRIDVFICNVDVGYAVLNKYFPSSESDRITFHAVPFEMNQLRLAFSRKNKKNEKFLKQFNRGLQALKDSGLYDQFYESSRNGDYEILEIRE
jgi:polar amino acid transport system substrate-binding protein